MNRNYDPQPRFYNLGVEPKIGYNCSLVDTLFDCVSQITIGDNVAFGHGCMILTSKHDYSEFGAQRMHDSFSEPITIQTGVWIGSGAIICGGVTLGEHSVVGAGSVVLKDIPPYQLWAGSPARFIKEIPHEAV